MTRSNGASMRAFVYRGPWRARVEDWPRPRLSRDTDVLVRVHACGVCGTDLGILAGRYEARSPVVLGHEAAGEVVEVGDAVVSVAVGDRVVLNPTYHCGCCRRCRAGWTNHCLSKEGTERGVSADGAFAEWLVADERFVLRTLPDLAPRSAILTEPLACALTGLRSLELSQGMRVAVMGAGPIGMLYALLLGLHGLGGTIVEPSQHRAGVASQLLGASWAVAGSADDLEPQSLDVVVEASGATGGAIVSLLDRGGQALLVALRSTAMEVDPGALADRSLRLVGTIDALGSAFVDALALLQAGRIPSEGMVTDEVALEDVAQGLERLGLDLSRETLSASSRALKVMVRP